jgi:cardiolipin synthase A/B
MQFIKGRNKAYLKTFTVAESISFHQSGPDFYHTLLSLISEANETLHIQMYIISDDDIGKIVLNALLKAAARNVEIFIIADGYGSRHLSEVYIQKLQDAGINFRLFSRISLFKNLSLGRRLHHKIVVADGQRALIGGINIADRYHGTKDKEAWLDFALEIRGPVCEQLEKICYQIAEKKFIRNPKTNPHIPAITKPVRISIRQNDWFRKKEQIYQSYNLAIQNAQKDILIFASYFLPGLRLRRALEAASKRGVKITIVLAGISDIPLALNGTYYLYHWLHKHNIQIYEWQKSVLHAKLAIVDDEWMTIGSFNLNHLSTYASIELNIDIQNPEFVSQTKTYLEKLIDTGCIEIPKNRKRSILIRTREVIAYYLGRTLIKTITFFPDLRNYYSKMVD